VITTTTSTITTITAIYSFCSPPLPIIWLDGLGNHENLSHGSQCVSQDLKLEPPEYKAGVLTS
jgi:hypothetical protein